MLEKVFEMLPEIYKYSHSAYSQPSFLFYGDSVIKSCEEPSKEILSLQFCFRFPFRIWLTVWRRIQTYGTLTMEIQVNIRAPFEKSQQNVDMEKTQGLKIKPTKCEIFFLGEITGKCRSTILASFQKLCPVIKVSNKDELIILGSPLGPKSQADLLEKKINELEKDNGIAEKLDAHYGFLCWKIASVCKSCCTSWEPVHVLIIQLSWNSMTKRYATGFPKCVMWTSTIFRVLSLLCPLKCIIPAFLASTFGASDFLTTIFWKLLKMFHILKRLRNAWVWRMNRKVLSMEPRKNGCNLSSSKPPKIWFPEWMTIDRKCPRLKNPVLPRLPVEICIRCLLIRDTTQFYALQLRWFPGYIKSLDSGDWVREHPQPWHPTPAVYPFSKESW